MLSWFKRRSSAPGWLAASVEADRFDFAHGRYSPTGKSAITAYGTRRFDGAKHAMEKLARAMRLDGYQCATMLRPGEYQLLLVEAPAVPPAELKSAMRWRVKDMIDYHVDDATLDLLDIPPGEGASASNHVMYAVCARNEVIQSRIRPFEEARVPLRVVDIPETAQRNIAALYEDEGRGCALVHFDEGTGLLTVNFGAELYLARRLEIGLKQLEAGLDAGREDAFERIGLELQRTFDHFDRQFRNVAISKLLVGPMPRDVGLVAYLRGAVALPVESVDLADRLVFDGAAPDAATQSRLFYHFGAALRHEAKTL